MQMALRGADGAMARGTVAWKRSGFTLRSVCALRFHMLLFWKQTTPKKGTNCGEDQSTSTKSVIGVCVSNLIALH